MFSFFNRKKPKRRYSPEHSPLQNDENGEVKEEETNDKDDLVRADSLASLTQELQTAQNQIKVILEQKKHLESVLLEKEKYNLSLIEKISTLTIAFSKEKEAFVQEQKSLLDEHIKLLEEQKNFFEEKKTLLQRIDLLQSELSAKEREYQILLEKIPPLESVFQEKMDLLQQNKLLQEQYQSLLKKHAELEMAKHKVEQELSQEVNDHNQTKELLEKEKKMLLDREAEIITAPDSPMYIRNDLNFFSPKDMTRQNDFVYPVDVGFKH